MASRCLQRRQSPRCIVLENIAFAPGTHRHAERLHRNLDSGTRPCHAPTNVAP
jgi:hypothetical protein